MFARWFSTVTLLLWMLPSVVHAQPATSGSAANKPILPPLSLAIAPVFQGAWGSDATQLDPGFAFRIQGEAEIIPSQLNVGMAIQDGTLDWDLQGSDTKYTRFMMEVYAKLYHQVHPLASVFLYGGFGYHKDKGKATFTILGFTTTVTDKDDGAVFSLGAGVESRVHRNVALGMMMRGAFLTWDDKKKDEDDIHHWDMMAYIKFILPGFNHSAQ